MTRLLVLVALGVGCADATGTHVDNPAGAEGEGEHHLSQNGPRCSAALPDGPCPTGRVCVDGGCIVDLDPGDARSADDVAKWDQIWSRLDESYGGFPAKPDLDWSAVHDDVAAQIAASTTKLEAEWAMARGVARLEDGHTAFSSTYLCDLDAGFSYSISNLGACATEIDGSLFVYRALPAGTANTSSDTGLEAGDEILAVDGRTFDELIDDLSAQPRCVISASTPEQARARLVESILFRAESDSVISVRRADGFEEDLPIALAQQVIDCDGRIGVPPGEVYAGGVEGTMLPGNVGYLHFPLFGTFSGNDFIDQPTIDGLGSALADLSTASGLVIDLRNNGGGYVSVYMALASWLYDAPTALFGCRNKNGSAHDAFAAPYTQTSQPDTGLVIDAPVVVLTSPTSFSAADFTPMFLHDTGRALTMGQSTGGGFGAGNGEDFGDDFIAYSNVLCSDLNGALLEGHPPAVDVPLAYDPQDVERGVDTLIEAARVRLAP